MQQSPVRLNGVDLAADFSGGLWWPAERTLIVADMHLEKGSGYARRGQFLPPYDTGVTLERLEATLARLRPVRVICLGDSFHDGKAGDRIGAHDSRRIAALTAAHDWLWIAGNHDRHPPTGWGGRVEAGITIGALVFRHEAAKPFPGGGEVSGHYHPKAAVHIRGRRVSARCFVSDGRRLVLPAFGAYAGGLNVLDPAIARLFAPRLTVQMLGRDRVHPVAADWLRPESASPTHLLSRMA